MTPGAQDNSVAGVFAGPEWSGPPRQLALAIDTAVAAASNSHAAAFDEAVTKLGALDREQVGVLLGALTRNLLERAHPDGLDAEDVTGLLSDCATSAAPWWPQLDRDHLIRAIIGALGVSEVEDSPADASDVLAHGVLLVEQLLLRADEALAPSLEAALRELMRAQTVEFP